MSSVLVLSQLLNSLQLGVLLFLMAAGLTLVFGIMNFVNLAHGSFYMLGAYFSAVLITQGVPFWLAGALAVAGTACVGLVLERLALTRLFGRGHLYQVLATFGLILVFNELTRFFWGVAPLNMDVPQGLTDTVSLFGVNFPEYRGVIIAVGLSVAGLLYGLINKTRLGMLIRAGASKPEIVAALGVNIKFLNTAVFALGAALAGLAGFMAGPILSVQSGMGENVLIVTLVVIVTGGIGSIRGAFFGALIIGTVETMGKVFLPVLFSHFMEGDLAQAAGPAVSSMLIYLVMAVVLALRPQGLFPVRHG